MLRDHNRYAVFCVGGQSSLEEEFRFLAPDVDITVAKLSDEQMRAAYSGAQALVYPSKYEGFGMPVLEAMAAGVPVVCSNRSAIPEVAGDAAILVNAESGDEIADALSRLIHDEGLRASLIQKGRMRAADFSWEEAVRKTWAVYQELL